MFEVNTKKNERGQAFTPKLVERGGGVCGIKDSARYLSYSILVPGFIYCFGKTHLNNSSLDVLGHSLTMRGKKTNQKQEV